MKIGFVQTESYALAELVAHTGFEPVISSLRGRCPRPLDECATHGNSTRNTGVFTMALHDKSVLSRPRGASHRSIETYDYAVDNLGLSMGRAQTMSKRLKAETGVRCSAHSYRA